jgi:hypothetical protein
LPDEVVAADLNRLYNLTPRARQAMCSEEHVPLRGTQNIKPDVPLHLKKKFAKLKQ